MTMILRALIFWMALILVAPQARAQAISPLGASVTSTGTSARVALPASTTNYPALLITPALGNLVSANYVIGNSSVAAPSGNRVLPNGGVCISNVGPGTNLAIIVGSGSATVNLTQAVTCQSFSGLSPSLGGGGGITRLTGDVTAGPGSGSQAATIAAIQGTRVSGVTGTGNVVFSTSPTLTGNLTINLNSASLPTPQTGTVLQVGNVNGTDTRAELDAFGAIARYTCVRQDGTAAAPTTLQSGDQICSLNSFGYDGTSNVGPQAAFRTFANQNWTHLSALGTYADVAVTPNGSTTLTQVMKFTGTLVSVPSVSFGLSGNISSPAWTTSGIRYQNVAATLTDTTSTGTVAAAYTDVWGGNTIAASSAVVFTNYYGAYFQAPVAGTNVTLTKNYALGADSFNATTIAQNGTALNSLYCQLAGCTMAGNIAMGGNAITGLGSASGVNGSGANQAGTALPFIPGLSTGTGLAGAGQIMTGFASLSENATVTVTSATPAVVTYTAHGLVPGASGRFSNSGGALPAGISAATDYFVCNDANLTVNKFDFSLTFVNGACGTLINTTTTGTGTQTFTTNTTTQNPASTVVAFGPSGLVGSQTTPAVQINQVWNTSGNIDAALRVNVTNITSGASAKIFDVQIGGVTQFNVDKLGNANVAGNVRASGAIISIASTGEFYFTNRSQIFSPADGQVDLTNNAGTSFSRLQLGGTTSSFPAIKLNGAALNFRLADDSGDASVTMAGITASGGAAIGVPTGGIEGNGAVNAAGAFYANGVKGVTCSGALTVVASITITQGIITAATGTGGTCS